MSVSFSVEARRELDDAVAFHERERPGHGDLLLSEVETKLERAERFPRSGAIVRGLERHDVRTYGLRRFPFSLVTASISGATVVIAFAHTNREPDYWRQRVP